MASNEITFLVSAQDQASVALSKVGSSLGSLEDAGRKLMSALGPLAGALAVNEIVETAVAWDGYEKALKAVTGTTDGARAEMDYIWKVADNLGASVDALAPAWIIFSANAKATGFSLSDTRNLFEAVTSACMVLGLSTEDTSRVFYGFNNILSKGSIQSEEVKLQIGEKLPGALSIFARAAGFSESAFMKLMEQGKVGLDILPKVTEELRKTFAIDEDAESAQQAINRFNNAITKMQNEIADAGILDLFVSAMKALGEVVSDPRVVESIRNMGQSFDVVSTGSGPALIAVLQAVIKIFQSFAIGSQVVITALQLVGDTLAAVAAAIAFAAEGEFKKAWDVLQDPTPANNFNKNMDLLQKSTEGFWGAADKAADGARKLGDESKATAGKTGELTLSTTQSTAAIGKSTEAKNRDAVAAEKAAASAEKMALENAKLAVELEKIASNERIKKIEFAVELKTEQLKADVEIAKGIMETLSTTIQDTGDLLGSLFGNLKGATDRERWAIEDQIKLENQRRDQALQMQKDLTEAQIEALQAKTDMMRSGSAMIQMTLDGVEPELEMIMWKIVDRLQARVNEEMASFLLGVPA